MHFLTGDWIGALLQVITIDLVLAGDNAIVIGLAAAGLPRDQRNKAILIGIGVATVMRIGFALITTQLLAITGLLLAGGILLLWVSWKMWRELREGAGHDHIVAHEALADASVSIADRPADKKRKTLGQAVMQIVIADVSMSLDNVLAVAGAARHHLDVLVIGLGLSIALMGLASTWIARLINRFRWIAWIGLLIILFVALRMIWEGWHEVAVAMEIAA